MNSYAVIIFTTLIFSFLLQIVSDMFNLRALRTELPDEFREICPPEKYALSREYTRAKTKFGFVAEFYNLTLVLGFWFSGGFNSLDIYMRYFNFSSPVTTGLCYIAILLLAKSILSFPFDIYSTFVLEERFGFNRMGPKTYIADLIKGIFLSILLGGPILAGVLFLFESLGDYAWVPGWGAVTMVSLFLQFIAPAWILPIFNKFTPLTEGDLRSSILEYAKSVHFPIQNLFVMDGSKRSSKSNAFFTGFGKNKRIALYDTLIEKHTTEELTAVLAHEIGHYKKKHIIQGMILSVIHTGILFFLLSIALSRQGLFDAFYMERMSNYAGLIFFGLLYTPVEMLLSILLNMLSRKNEFEADRFATETYKKPEAMIIALKKLSIHNLSHLTPHPFYVFINYSHPPVIERIRAIREGVHDSK